jgi:release factor glutamine methyltransferase
MTCADLLQTVTARLREAGVQDADFDARQLLLSVLRVDTSAFLLRRFLPVDPKDADAAFALARRRADGEPLQYLLGAWCFLDETFRVGPGVLIPRPETETLVLQCEALLQEKQSPVILDLCAGTGCIGLSLQKRIPAATVVLIELSDAALRYLRQNARDLAVADRVLICKGDVLCGPGAFEDLPKADLIVSNPPYIPESALASLQREVQSEPRMALDGGEDGLLFYRRFSSDWRQALKPDGVFAFECGEGQGAAIGSLFEPFGFHVEIVADFNGFDRFVFASQGRKDRML